MIQSKTKAAPPMQRRNRIRVPAREKAFNVFNIVLMLFLIVVTAYPFLYVVFASFSDPTLLSRVRGPLLGPMGLSLRGYEAVSKMPRFWQAYGNTLFYLVAGSAISLALTILGAYVLSIKGFLLRKPFMVLIILTMYFSGGMIPTFLVIKQMGIIDSVWAILVPNCVSVYYLIVMRTAFEELPTSLHESAAIDGANHFVIMFRIILPLSKASLATITLFYAVGRWGDWYNAMVYLPNRGDLFPMQMFLRQLLLVEESIDMVGGSFTNEGSDFYLMKQVIRYAAVVLSTIPVLVVYPFLQKYFIKGLMIGAVKG